MSTENEYEVIKKRGYLPSCYGTADYGPVWESRVSAPGTETAGYTQEDGIRHFHLTAQPVTHHILSNLAIEALGYNGSTPGPLIIIKQGEWIHLTVENRTDSPTSLHVHGLSKPNSQDGDPDIEPGTPRILPGESYTYQFQCWQAGSFFYHSPDPAQVAGGLIGAFIVLPRSEYISSHMIPNRDYVLLMQQWNIPQPETGKVFPGTYRPEKFDNNPNFFTINGKSFPDTVPLQFRFGEKIRIRFITKSSSSHTMHLHGHDFRIVAVDGFTQPGYWDDTVDLASGRRIDVELIAGNPGIWPLHGTKTFHQTNNGETPGGMTTKAVYI